MPCVVNVVNCCIVKRYTTPTCIFELDIEPELIKDCQILFEQFEKILFVKQYRDCEINNEEKIISVKLNEEETSTLNHRFLLQIQIRAEFQDGGVDNSNIMHVNVEDVLGNAVM